MMRSFDLRRYRVMHTFQSERGPICCGLERLRERPVAEGEDREYRQGEIMCTGERVVDAGCGGVHTVAKELRGKLYRSK